MTKYCNIRTNKEDEARRAFYRRLCEGACGGSDAGSRDGADGSAGGRSSQAADIPLFAQAWWLDAACPDAWTVLTYPEDGGATGFEANATDNATADATGRIPTGGAASDKASATSGKGAEAEILAAMPVFTPYGNTVVMPPFTQTSYIWQNPDSQVKKHKILRALAESLARYRYVYLQLSPGQWQALPFYWRGLNLGVRYTYRLSDLERWRKEGDVATALREGMGRDSRRRLRMAEDQGIEVKPCPVEEAAALCRQTLAARGERMSEAQTACLKRLMTTTLERRQGLVWGGYDAEGRLLSTAFVAYQGRTAYYVAGGSEKASSPHTHAQTLVLFKAVVHCAEFCDIFDFEGSMIEGVAQFFQGFGSAPHPYLTLSGRRPGLCLRAWRKFLHLTGLCGKPPRNR